MIARRAVHGALRTVRGAACAACVLALAVAGCARPSAEQPVAAPPPAAAPRVAAAPPPPVAEPPRQADQLARIASELVELQNAIAKLMMSARQHDDQLLYLQRRIAELETQARNRAGAVPPAFAPSAAVPAPLPPPPGAGAPPAPAPSPLPRTARPTAPAAPNPPAAAAPLTAVPTVPTSPGEVLYQSGLSKYEAGDLDGAVVTLYEVVATFPGDPARERAQFLIGEIFLSQKDYRGAVGEFESMIAAVPAGSHVPEALLKIGMAQRSLGDEARARRAWEKLVKEHPNSAAARQARTLLRARS
jgi:tol-pal system protein YbgF